jgi:hypothetical protein
LLGVIEFGGAAGFLAEHVVNISEGLFKHDDQAIGMASSKFRFQLLG